MASTEGVDARQNPWGIRGVYNPLFQFDALQSSTRSCEDKQEREYLPNTQQTFSPTGYETITFDVSANEEVISFKEMVFSFRLRFSCEVGSASTIAKALQAVILQENGVHNLFRSVSIYSKGTGAPIEQMQNYNKFFNVWSTLHQPASHVKNVGSNWLDSFEDMIIWKHDAPNDLIRNVKYQNAGVVGLLDMKERYHRCGATGTYTTGTQVLTAIPESAGLNIGDVIYLTISTDVAGSTTPAPVITNSGIFIVQSITYAANNLSSAVLAGPTIATFGAGDTLPIFTIVGRVAERFMITSGVGRLSSSGYNTAALSAIASTLDAGDGLTVYFKPKLPFLDMDAFPLLLLQGLEFRFELELPYRCIKAVPDVASSAMGANYTYQVTEPRFYAMLYKPEVSVRQDLYALSASPSGITWAKEAYQVFRVSLTPSSATELSAQVMFGFRSLIDAVLIFQDSSLHENNDLTYGVLNDSHGQWINDGIYSWQAQIGSDQWPAREYSLTDQHLGKAYEMIRTYFPEHNEYRFRREEYMPHSVIRTGYTAWRRDSSKFCAYLHFGTDANRRTNLFTGIDTTNTPCDFRIKKRIAHNDTTKGPAYPGDLVMYIVARYHKLYNLKNATMTTYK
jgi:hypothetical protein